jgi:hypothetical protein
MSYAVHFMLSWGLSAPLTVPKGTKQRLLDHVAGVERLLNLKRVASTQRYRSEGDTKANGPDYPDRWDYFDRDWSDIEDELLCKTIEDHNAWVVFTFEQFQLWAKTPFTPTAFIKESEVLTPEDAREIWPGFEKLTVPVERWSGDYYRARMEHLFEVMRGRPSCGVTFDAKPLSQQQAGAVIRLFSEYLDAEDLRLEVVQSPGRGFNGLDRLASLSYDDGGYWCDGCSKTIDYHFIGQCERRKCPLKSEDES